MTITASDRGSGQGRFLPFLAALIVILTAAAPPSPRAELDALLAADARVAAVAYRLAREGVDQCARRGSAAGVSLHHPGQYREDLRRELSRFRPTKDAVMLSVVVPESAAARAGLRTHDAIIAVDGSPLPASGPPSAQVAAAERALNPPDRRQLVLSVLRGERPVSVRIAPEPACRSRVQLLPARRARAGADGELVTITTPLLAFLRNDDELAFVLAHEIAHNALEHRATHDGSARPSRKSRELAADRLALRLMAEAGFHTDTVVPLVERLYREGPAGGFLSALGHLGRRERIAALRMELGKN